jgi:hypothetical protein
MDGLSGERWRFPCRRPVQPYPIDPDRPRNVFELLLTHILASKVNPSDNFFVNLA